MFSLRTQADTGFNALASALAERRGRGAPIWDLTISNPLLAGFEAQAELSRIYAAADFGYRPEPLGLSAARDSLQAELAVRGLQAERDRIFLTASTSEAYSYAFRLLCDPGDEVLVPAPSYPLFEYLARYEGVELRPYRLAYESGWQIDWPSVERAWSNRTRAVIAVSPNNPTGNYLSQADFEGLSNLGDAALIVDEVFARYPLPGHTESSVLGFAHQDRGLVIALDGLSKAAALPQLKLGWLILAGAGELVREAQRRLELVADAYLSASTVTQSVLGPLLEFGARRRARVSERLFHNWRVLQDAVRGSSSSLLHSEGGWYAVLRLPAVASEEDWVLWLLERGDVLVHPGFFYDFPSEPYAVVSLLCEPSIFQEGAVRLVAAVEARLSS